MLPLNQGNGMVCSGKDICFADRQTEVCIPKQPLNSWVALVISFFKFLFYSGGGNATHSSILAWKIPWTEEPGRLQSVGSQRVRHDLANECTYTQSINNIVLLIVSGVQQGDSVIQIHISILFQILFPFRLL